MSFALEVPTEVEIGFSNRTTDPTQLEATMVKLGVAGTAESRRILELEAELKRVNDMNARILKLCRCPAVRNVRPYQLETKKGSTCDCRQPSNLPSYMRSTSVSTRRALRDSKVNLTAPKSVERDEKNRIMRQSTKPVGDVSRHTKASSLKVRVRVSVK